MNKINDRNRDLILNGKVVTMAESAVDELSLEKMLSVGHLTDKIYVPSEPSRIDILLCTLLSSIGVKVEKGE